ncbi:MAG TPA: class I SAM-dependent methyltransferase [Hanamia sp.]|nr:class I SAM-dependent methyltransferase [Hanamia sp.]
MEPNKKISQPDNTAVRTALWGALHIEIDAKPHILEDETGLQLIAPDKDWHQRPDMDLEFTKRLRASMVARARFIEDLIIEQSKKGIRQYVILGAGLDTFAQRRPDIASRLHVYEIDQPGTQTWKQQRLIELGFGVPKWLHFAPVNFEISPWWDQLLTAGFDIHKPAVVACTGVTLCLTKQAISDTLHQMAKLAPGSKLAMTFYLPIDLIDEEDKPLQQISEKGARNAGTPMISFFTPDEILALANEAGFKESRIISSKDLEQYYFTNRTDNLIPAIGEIFLLATM